jgi:DNA polymerase III subunit delta
MDSFVYLDSPDSAKVQPLYVLHGDEEFLKRQVLKKLRRCLFGADAGDAPVSVVAGDKATFADVFDEVESVGLFTSRRLVVVDNADPFVSKHRPQLEAKLGKLSAAGVLVLDVKTWAGNTRLAKMVPASMTIVCKGLPVFRLADWCVKWALSQQQKQLSAPAASHLVDLIGPDMGLLDQEILKLAIYVGAKPRIDVNDVDRLVGHSRGENIWHIFDAIAEGRNAEALAMLGRLFDQGEEPMRLMGAFGSQMRKLARAARLSAQGKRIGEAMEAVGIAPFALKNTENQLRHLGRRRTEKLYDWLLEATMGMRGDSSLSERTLIERMLVRMCGKNA